MAVGFNVGKCNVVGQLVHVASTTGGWVNANADLETADTANLLQPYNVTRAAVTWIKVPDGATRCKIRGRNEAVMSAAGTPTAVVRVWGANGTPSSSGFSGTPGQANYAEFMRLDNADSNAAGISLTFATTGNLEDATWEYTDLPDLTGYDCQACNYVTVLVETVCALTGALGYADLKFMGP